MPSGEELRVVIARLHPQHVDLCLGAHRRVMDAVSGVRFEVDQVDQVDGAIGYGVRQFGYGGWGMAAHSPHRGWVSLFFKRGAALRDSDGVLEESGRLLRHVKLRSLDDLAAKRAAILSLLETAAGEHHA